MGQGAISLVVCLLGLALWAESASISNSRSLSMSQMLSSLFIEPQGLRSYRSTPEEPNMEVVQAEEARLSENLKDPSLDSPPKQSADRPSLPQQQLPPGPIPSPPGSQMNINSPPQPSPSELNVPLRPNFGPTSGDPTRPNFNLPPGPPRSVNAPPMFNPNARPNGPSGQFQQFPPQRPFRSPQQGLSMSSGGQSLNSNFKPPPLQPNSPPIAQFAPSSVSSSKWPPRPNPNFVPSRSDVMPSFVPDPNLPPNSNILQSTQPSLKKSNGSDESESPELTDQNGPLDEEKPPSPASLNNAKFANSQEEMSPNIPTPNQPILTETPPSMSSPSNIPPREAQFFSPRPRPPRQFIPPPFSGRAPQRPPQRPMSVPSSFDIAEEFLFHPKLVKRTQCIGVNGSMIGECSDPIACQESGGKSVGLCPGKPGAPEVCCSFISFCNFMTNVERAYLSSPKYPDPVQNIESCAFQLSPLEDVCQVRIDFLDFHLKPPVNGVCEDDNALHIESNDPNAFIPIKKLCGTLSEESWDPLSEDVPHMYVHFKSMDDGLVMSSEKSPPKRLRYPNKPENLLALKIRVTDSKSSWNIRINQISCGGGARQQSPFGCAQYFTGENGRIRTLNFQDGNYLKNLDFTSCIKSDPEACGITYNMQSGTSIGETPGGISFGRDCPGDYVQFSGQKAGICGSFLSNTSFAFENNKGPQSLHFHSDSRFHPLTEVGYSLNYEHLYNCRDTRFFDYNQFGI